MLLFIKGMLFVSETEQKLAVCNSSESYEKKRYSNS